MARLAILRAGQAPRSLPTDGTAYAANPAFGTGSSPAADEYVVYNSTGTSVNLTSLQANTTYYYAVFEASGTGCAANYLQSAPLTGSFVTPPCVVGAKPTMPASLGTATPPTIGSGSLIFGAGSGASTFTYTDPIPDQATYYYYAVITQADGNKFWTAPIRYTRNDALAAPLPVTLTSFQAVLQNECQAVLRWTTASEINSAYFVVERSLDGQAFAEVGRLPAAGSSAQPHNYELRDPRPLTGRTYYRLRQVDTNQTFAYSPTVTLTPSAREAAQINVYPNPSAGTAVTRVALRGLTAESVTVRVVDVLGRTVTTQQIIPIGYQADVPLVLPSNLAPGIYGVTLSSNGQTWTTRLVLEP